MNRNLTVGALAMGAAALVAYGLSRALLSAPCWSLIFLVACVAWPMWVGQCEYALFQRRLTLIATTREESRVRRWLWRGRFTSFVQMLSALCWAALLLVFVPLLDRWHLGVLAADVVVLVVVAHFGRAFLAADVREEHVGLLSRRWVLSAVNLAVLATSFFVVDYLLVGSPDTRGVAWSVVAERAFSEFNGQASCPMLGMAIGFLNAADRLAWHVAEVLFPGLPGVGYKALAWSVFLLQAGLVSFAYTRFQMGVLAVVARFREPPTAGAHRSRDSLFPASLPILALAVVLLAQSLRGFDPATVRPLASEVVNRINPCRSEAPVVAVLGSALNGQVEAHRVAQRTRSASEINRSLDEIFKKAEAGVDDYLDWYFSLTGEYQRLWVLVGSRSVDKLRARIDAEVEKSVLENPRVVELLSAANRQIAEDAAATFVRVAAEAGRQLNQQSAKPCWSEYLNLPAIPSMERDVRAVTVSAVSGAMSSLATRVVAARFGRTMVASLAKKPAYRSAASIAASLVGKRAGSIVVSSGTGAAVCAPGGPLAVLCGLAGGAVAWVAVDKVQIEIDELRFRDAMRREIIESLRLQKAQVAQEMLAVHEGAIDRMASQMQASLTLTFIPARDGMR
jgi:hypothetical protein